MTPESDNFDQLKRLLALKRHEVPPPGFFNNFSRNVTSRLRAGESGAESVSWFQRLTQLLDVKPAFAGACGLAVCALLLGGILYSAKIEGTPQMSSYPTLPMTGPSSVVANNTLNLTPGVDYLNGQHQPDSLFNSFVEPHAVTFKPAGN